jgi:hypothetical protein
MKHKWLLFLIMPISAFADMVCNTNIVRYNAFYEINKYTCAHGQYLPANTLGCVSCPNGFTCPGGTFEFNPDYFQGIDFNVQNISSTQINNICSANFPVKIFVLYEPNIHTCTPGYYLPANVDECVPCTQNNKCVGGTYTFNETITQGIEQCANNTFAPTGSSVCYPHILHVGNDIVYMKSTKTTTPSLNTKINNDYFYANMTTIPTYMSKDSTHYLKTIYNDQIYYICDDTTCPN